MVRWKPSHCACVIEFDDLVAVVVRACVRHAPLAGDAQALKAQLTVESQRLNWFLLCINADLPAQVPDKYSEPVIDEDTGLQIGTRLKDGVVTWAFDAAGVLTVTPIVTLTGGERNKVRNYLSTKYGAGIVLA